MRKVGKLSSRQAANQRNGRKSSGPKTPAGKARSSINSFRHGFSRAEQYDPRSVTEITQLAKAICGDSPHPELYELALTIASSELIITSVRKQIAFVIDRLREPTSFTYASKLRGVNMAYKMHCERASYLDKIIEFYEPSGEKKTPREDKPESIDTLLEGFWQPGHRAEFEAAHEVLRDIKRLERYLRRAWSRRRGALLDFIALRNRLRSRIGN